MNASELPLVSVVVATRNRGGAVAGTVRSILAGNYTNFEIRIIDQSADDRCRVALRECLLDDRVHYRHTATQGLAVARNLGIADAQGELIAITDDDCTAPENWLRTLLSAAAEDERIGIVFGRVAAAPHDHSRGFIPAYARQAPALLRGVGERHQADGIGACMGLRKRAWEALGGFDEMLGVGAPLRANSEGDLVFRALRDGYFVYETPQFAIIHHGFRTWQEGYELIQRYWYGTGAMYAKHLKIAPAATVKLLLPLAWRWAFGRSLVASSIGPKARKLQRLVYFLSRLGGGSRDARR